MEDDEYVNAFSLDTWGVRPLATCRIPAGWTITAGSSADPSGTISGEGSLGTTWLGRARLRQLTGLVLVRLDPPIRRNTIRSGTGEVPATFLGHAMVGQYGGDDDDRKVPLTWRNVRLVRASRCPSPRP